MTAIRKFVRRAADRMGAGWSGTERRFSDETMSDQDDQISSLPLSALAPVPLIISRRAAGQVLYANAAALALFEAPANAYRQLPTMQFYVRPEDRAEILRRMARTGSLSNFEVELRSLTGRKFWALVAASLTDYRDERAVVMIITDISAQKQRENQQAAADHVEGEVGDRGRRSGEKR